jgi:hypothetical protein
MDKKPKIDLFILFFFHSHGSTTANLIDLYRVNKKKTPRSIACLAKINFTHPREDKEKKKLFIKKRGRE